MNKHAKALTFFVDLVNNKSKYNETICVSIIIRCVSKVIQRNNFDGPRDYCASRKGWGCRTYLVDKATKLYKRFIQFCDDGRDYLASRVGQRMVQIWQKFDREFFVKLYLVDL